MAIQSVATQRAVGFIAELDKARKSAAQQITHEWDEDCAFERIAYRLDGIQALTVVAQAAMEAEGITDKVVLPLLSFVHITADDIHRDAEQLWREGRELFDAGKEAQP